MGDTSEPAVEELRVTLRSRLAAFDGREGSDAELSAVFDATSQLITAEQAQAERVLEARRRRNAKRVTVPGAAAACGLAVLVVAAIAGWASWWWLALAFPLSVAGVAVVVLEDGDAKGLTGRQWGAVVLLAAVAAVPVTLGFGTAGWVTVGSGVGLGTLGVTLWSSRR